MSWSLVVGGGAASYLKRLLSSTLLQVLEAWFSDLHGGFDGAGHDVVHQELSSLCGVMGWLG